MPELQVVVTSAESGSYVHYVIGENRFEQIEAVFRPRPAADDAPLSARDRTLLVDDPLSDAAWLRATAARQGDRAAVVDANDTVHVVDGQGAVLASFPGEAPVAALDLDAAGERVLIGRETFLEVWPVAGGEAEAKIENAGRQPCHAQFVRDQVVAFVDRLGHPKLWNPTTDECFTLLVATPRRWVAYSEDGAACGTKSGLALLRSATGKTPSAPPALAKITDAQPRLLEAWLADA